MILLADSEGPDQTRRRGKLIWAFAIAYAGRCVLHGGPYFYKDEFYTTPILCHKQFSV